MDENYEDCRIDVGYRMAIAPWRARSYIEGGKEDFCGFAIDAAQVSGMKEVGDFIDLFCGAIAPAQFSPSEPIHILEVPTNPFVQASRAVGALHPDALLGGISEISPYDGSGTASGGGFSTDLLWIEPTRLTAGAELWRYYPGNPSPELCGIYCGTALGWRNMRTGKFVASAPSDLIGPVVKRDWAQLPVDVEIEEGEPVAATMVAPVDPQQEEGFKPVSSGMWVKRIELSEDDAVYENQRYATINRVQSRLVRFMRGQSGEKRVLAVARAIDANYAESQGFARLEPGVFACFPTVEEVAPIHVDRRAAPFSWNTAGKPAVTRKRKKERSNYDVAELLEETALLVTGMAPPKWERCDLVVQLVGRKAKGEGHFVIDAEKDERQFVDSLPVAILKYLAQIKVLHALQGQGAPLAYALSVFRGDLKNSEMIPFPDEHPPLLEHIAPEDWQEELDYFPRDEEPEWARRLMDR
mgnify:FL=1